MVRGYFLALLLLALAGVVQAHDEPAQSHDHAKVSAATAAQTPFGIAGDRSRATRTVAVDMTDGMRFIPSELAVKRGETIRFVVSNKGAVLHEMVLGTKAELARHAELMKKKSPEMHHDAGSMVHVKPGAEGEIVWRFNRVGTFQYACLVPGHFDAGMIGTITVK